MNTPDTVNSTSGGTTMPTSLCGFWTLPSLMMPDELEYMYVAPEGRILQSVIMGSVSPPPRCLMRLWANQADSDSFLIRVKYSVNGYMVRLWISDGLLMIENNRTLPGRLFSFHLVMEQDCPPWFHTMLQDGISKMDAEEAESK